LRGSTGRIEAFAKQITKSDTSLKINANDPNIAKRHENRREIFKRVAKVRKTRYQGKST
jgi:hypothetical protein